MDRLLACFCLLNHINHLFMHESKFGLIDASTHIVDGACMFK